MVKDDPDQMGLDYVGVVVQTNIFVDNKYFGLLADDGKRFIN